MVVFPEREYEKLSVRTFDQCIVSVWRVWVIGKAASVDSAIPLGFHIIVLRVFTFPGRFPIHTVY